MTRERITYRIGPVDADDSMVGSDPFVIACDGKAIIRNNQNGTAQYMTYKTRNRAEDALRMVRVASLPNAVVHERGGASEMTP